MIIRIIGIVDKLWNFGIYYVQLRFKLYLVVFGNFIMEKIIIFDYLNYWGCGKIMEFWYILCSIEI